MKISSQEEYGLRCILQLARQPQASVSLSEIAGREALTATYAGKLLSQLRDAGLVQAVRGRSGGYTLSRPPAEISVSEVIRAFNGQLFEVDFCENRSGTLEECIHQGTGCSLKALWGVLDSLVDAVLSSTSLADLLSFAGLQQLRAEGERLLEARETERSRAQ